VVNIMTLHPTQIALLGTGNPNPDPLHSGPSIAIIVNETPYLIDFGPGVVRQAAALSPHYGGRIPALEARNLKQAFLTHLHSDHTIGYPDLVLTPWVMGRKQPLEVYGPIGTQVLTDHILKAYWADIEYRLDELEPANDLGWQVTANEFEEGEIYIDDNIRVEAFKVKHGTWSNAYGFRFTTPDKVIVISGDTAPCENIRKFSAGADILIHEVYYQHGFDTLPPEWQAYHASHHTSTVELARLAQDVQPGLLVTYHTLFWGGSEQDILNEIEGIYAGKVIIGKDLQIID
jgi:ribonuclease BN (tRNA processing enzyme)